MMENSELIRQARNLAHQRGHQVGEFLAAMIDTGYPAIVTKECLVGRCAYCGAAAAVDASPPPGGKAIFGEAVEKDCPGEVFI